MPENRDYQYNFYFDNCATRPRDMIEAAVGGLKYQLPADSMPTFREAIRQKSRTAVWYTMGARYLPRLEERPADDAPRCPPFSRLLEQEMDSALQSILAPALSQQGGLAGADQADCQSYDALPLSPLDVIGMGLLLALFKWGRWDRLLRVSEKDHLLSPWYQGIVVWFLALFPSTHTWPNANMLFLHPFWLILTFAHGKSIARPISGSILVTLLAIIAYLLRNLRASTPSDLPTLAVVVAIDQWLHWRDANKLTRLNE